MLKRFINWFEQQVETAPDPIHNREIATAALLCEVVRADNNTSEAEQSVYLELLQRQFSLSDAELDEISRLGASRSEDAVDLQQFTHVINAQCSAQEKRDIVKDMWSVAYADFSIDPQEEHIIRRIADLLHVPHSQFIQTKLDVIGDN